MASTPALERRYTTEEYETLEDRSRFELVDGCLVEREMSIYSSRVASLINYFLQGWALQFGGVVIESEVGLRIDPERPSHTRRADVGFVSSGRIPTEDSGYLRIAPDLVVEVISPGDSAKDVLEKAAEWLRFGVRMVWVVYPNAREVHVYATGEHPRIVTADDVMEAPTVLPGFSVQAVRFFPES